MTPLKQMFEQLVALIPVGHSVIVKLQQTPQGVTHSIGRVSPAGTYKDYYADNVPANTYLTTNLLPHLRVIFDRFRAANTRKRTLFFRYNDNTKKLETFTAGGMQLTAKVNLI